MTQKEKLTELIEQGMHQLVHVERGHVTPFGLADFLLERGVSIGDSVTVQKEKEKR